MSPLQNVRHDVRNAQFRTALLLGVASIPCTIGSNWILRPDPVLATPLVVACVLSGYRYGSRSESGTRAGAVTAIAGGTPILLWQSGLTLLESWRHPVLVDIVGDSWLMALFAAGAAGVTFVLAALTLLLVGRAGGFVGEWTNDRLDTVRKTGFGA